MGNGWAGGRWSDVEGGTWLKESWGAKKCDGKWVVWNGVGAQGEGHDGMRGEIRGEGAWLRNTKDGETRMGDWWTGGRWSDVEGGA